MEGAMSTRTVSFGAIAIVVASMPLLAHHAWPVDLTNPVTLTGTVSAFTWANPHVMIALDVQQDGSIEQWTFGASSPSYLTAAGWDRHTLKPGDVVSATGYRFRDGSRMARLEKLVTPSGLELSYGPRTLPPASDRRRR
jgi:hypothetical protein